MQTVGDHPYFPLSPARPFLCSRGSSCKSVFRLQVTLGKGKLKNTTWPWGTSFLWGIFCDSVFPVDILILILIIITSLSMRRWLFQFGRHVLQVVAVNIAERRVRVVSA